jgi:hypothetical protein
MIRPLVIAGAMLLTALVATGLVSRAPAPALLAEQAQAGSGATPPAPVGPPVEPAAVLPVAEASGMAGGDELTLSAGGLTIVVPAGSLATPAPLRLEVSPAFSAEQVASLPAGASLGHFRVTPWDPGLTRTARVTVTLAKKVEPGAAVELLGWQPSMLAFMVVGVGEANSTGERASFWVRQLGELVVRRAPVQGPVAASACKGPPLPPRGSYPRMTEDDAVGMVPLDERMDRTTALSVLSDFRDGAVPGGLEFKNEEDEPPQPRQRDRRGFRDEDYLMDPNAAAALTRLADLVRREWTDPETAQPAFRLRVTEAYDSMVEHSSRSTHYQGRANDLTLSPVPAATGEARRAFYGRLARLAVCAGYDYVLFENQFHVHASVVPTMVAVATRSSDGRRRLVRYRIGWPHPVEVSEVGWSEASIRQRSIRWMPSRAPVLDAVSGRATGGAGGFEGDSLVSAPVPAFADPDLLDTPGGVTADWRKRVVVRDGRVWLENRDGSRPAGSRDVDGRPEPIVYPVAVGPAVAAGQDGPAPADQRGEALAATVRAHGASLDAPDVGVALAK